jgi:hypothetical protein
MNANGIQIFTRAYNAASTAAQPAVVAIQIGKGLKGINIGLYGTAGKTLAGSKDLTVNSSTVIEGITLKDYDESTGILLIDAGLNVATSATVSRFRFSDTSTQTSGYLVINASKNPALTGLGLGTVAARGVNTAGTSIPNTGDNTVIWDTAKTYDTHGALNSATGIFTCPESGYYSVSCQLEFADSAYAITNQCSITVYKNGSVYAIGSILEAPAAVTVVMAPSVVTDVFLAKNDTIYIATLNARTAGATALRTINGGCYFSIHKTSVGTGN